MNQVEMEAAAKVLKGEYVGIDAYQHFLNRMIHKDIQHDLERHEQDLRKMITELEAHLRDQNAPVPESAGPMGVMAEWQNRLHLMGNPGDRKILELMYDGVKMGIEETEQEVIRLSDETKRIVSKHLERNRRILDEIGEYRNKL